MRTQPLCNVAEQVRDLLIPSVESVTSWKRSVDYLLSECHELAANHDCEDDEVEY